MKKEIEEVPFIIPDTIIRDELRRLPDSLKTERKILVSLLSYEPAQRAQIYMHMDRRAMSGIFDQEPPVSLTGNDIRLIQQYSLEARFEVARRISLSELVSKIPESIAPRTVSELKIDHERNRIILNLSSGEVKLPADALKIKIIQQLQDNGDESLTYAQFAATLPPEHAITSQKFNNTIQALARSLNKTIGYSVLISEKKSKAVSSYRFNLSGKFPDNEDLKS
ncbi:MAG: hypothetical protein M3Q44_08200 [bacterium]|nr:hypothetical protein [bacterium]